MFTVKRSVVIPRVMSILSLILSQFFLLLGWLFVLQMSEDAYIVQIFGLVHVVVYLICILFLFARRGAFSLLPWAYVSSLWFFYIDIPLGNFVSTPFYVAYAAFLASAFILTTTILYYMLKRIKFSTKFSNRGKLLSLEGFRFIFLLVPLILQFILARSFGTNQLLMLFGGRASGITFWGDHIPHYLRTLLSPLSYTFFMSATLFVIHSLKSKNFLITSFDLLIAFLVFLVALASGSRNVFLMAVSPAALVLFLRIHKKLYRIIFLFVLIALLPVFMQYQVSNRGLLDVNQLTIMRQEVRYGGANIVDMHRDGNIDTFASAVKSREEGLLLHTDYTDVVIASMQILPRAIFPFKPQREIMDYETGAIGFDPGYLSQFSNDRNVTGSLSITLPGDFFFADSVRGLAVGSIICSLLLRFGDFLVYKYKSHFELTSFYVLASALVFVALFSFRSYGGIMVYGVPLLLVYVVVVMASNLFRFSRR